MNNNKHEITDNVSYRTLLDGIGEIIVSARGRILREIDKTQAVLYWKIGRYIVEFEQKGNLRAGYGAELLKKLSADLVSRYGRGFSVDNLQNMRKFYIVYPKMFPIYETLSHKLGQKHTVKKYETLSRILSWSHYCELLKEENELARAFYEKESVENN